MSVSQRERGAAGRAVKLTPAQRSALENAVKHGRANFGISGRSAHGGYSTTRAVLLRNGWINPFNEKITDAGRAALLLARGSKGDE